MTDRMDRGFDVESNAPAGDGVTKPGSVPREVLVPAVPSSAGAAIDPPHVATTYFSTRFQELAGRMNVRMLDTNRVRKLTPLRIQRMLKEQAPDLPVSQTQIYRYFHGQAAPRLDVVYELARLFGVPPTYFVPDVFLPESD
jgi:transcriptional regulator with XRE-family HTH domain